VTYIKTIVFNNGSTRILFCVSVIVFSFLIGIFSPSLLYGKPLEVAIFIPREDPFWKKAVLFTEEAANDLGMKLRVYNANDDPDKMIAQVRKTVRSGIDGIIFSTYQNTGERILRIAEKNSVPSILINSQLPQADLLPRTKYAYWIGSVLPDDEKTGSVLIQQLINEARQSGIERFNVLALEGNPKDESSIARIRGLRSFMKHLKEVNSFKIVAGNWNQIKAQEIFLSYYKTQSDVNIVWCANDNMALGVLKAIKELGLEEKIVVGGVDWDKAAQEAILSGRMHVSVGGHFLDGAWAAVLLYDYLNGIDFANERLQFESPMVGITRANLEKFSPVLSLDEQSLNFRLFSKALNQQLKLYSLDLQAIANLITPQQISAGLTEEEKAWLADHKNIRIGVDPDYPPFDFVGENGSHMGIASEYVRLLEKRLGISMKVIPDLTWDQAVEGAKNRTIDVIPMITSTPEREAFLSFSKPYISFPEVIMTRRDYPAVGNLGDFAGNKVAVVKGYRSHKILIKEYPSIKSYVVGTSLEGLKAVSVGKADAFIGNLAVNSYLMQEHSIVNLKVAASADMAEDAFKFGVRKDWPELVTVLNKALNSLTQDEHRTIRHRWIQIDIGEEKQKQLVLTPEEKAWLAEHKDIRLGVDPTWPPFEFFDATKVYSGIASDYVRRLNKQLNIQMAPVPNLSWPEVMNKARAGEIDVLPCVAKTPERSKFLLFSEPYISFPTVILTRQDAPFVSGVQDFKNGKVAVVEGYVTQELLQRDHPDREFYLAKDIDGALQAVSKRKVDAFVGNLASITYTTQKLGLTNLKVAMTTPYKYELAFAVRKDWRELVNILNKSIESIPAPEKTTIHNRWINVRFERKTNWTLIFQIVGAIALVGGAFFILIIRWNRALSKEVAERKRTEEALVESRAAARALLDATQESLLLLDNKGIVLAGNETAASRLQMTPVQLKGTNLFDLLPSEIQKTRKAGFGKVLRSGTPIDFEDTRNGRIFHSSYFPIQAKTGEVTGVAIFAIDITERKRGEEKLHENIAELERFSKLAVGREERMIELKSEINEMLQGLGQPEKYKIVH
jgi:PAS domain S-box-containing protein